MFTLRVIWKADKQPRDGFSALEFRRSCGLREETRIRAEHKRHVQASLPLTVNDAERYKALFSGDCDYAYVSLDQATAAKFVVDIGRIGDIVGLSIEKMLPHKDELLTMAFQQRQKLRQQTECGSLHDALSKASSKAMELWRNIR